MPSSLTPLPSQASLLVSDFASCQPLGSHIYLMPVTPNPSPCTLYLLASKGDLHIRVNQVLVLPNERLLHVGHDAGVHTGQPLCSVDLHVEAGPLAFGGHTIREQQVPAVTYS